MWKWIETYFTFTTSQRNGILALLTASVCIFVAPSVYLHLQPPESIPVTALEEEINNFITEYNRRKEESALNDTADDPHSSGFNPYSYVRLKESFQRKEKKPVNYFYFDPNTIGEEDWIKLGFSERQAESIEKLKSKGFKFFKAEDLKKVYVISEETYSKLLPYVKIDESTLPKREFPKTEYPERKPIKYVVDINSADSSMFERQRGIGPSLASRIVKYRTRLGGFVSVEQISEVWGMPDSTYQALKDRFEVNNPAIQKLDVNEADVSTMGKHPYINFPLAKVIVAYRNQHGAFRTIEDLRKIPLVNDSVFRKIEMYVQVKTD